MVRTSLKKFPTTWGIMARITTNNAIAPYLSVRC